MPHRNIVLKTVSHEDVKRLIQWLDDDEVAESWFGRYSYGDPAHLGYHPEEILSKTPSEWDSTFNDPEHRILSIYLDDGTHIGEAHVAVEETLGDGQMSILIGIKEMWHHGHGSSTVRELIRIAFEDWGLYRLWVDEAKLAY